MSSLKPKRIKRIKIGWSCLNPDHFHLHEDVAARCIEKQSRPKQKQRRWTPEMYADVIKQRESGEKFKAIGSKYGIGVARIIQVYNKAERIERNLVLRAQRQAETTTASSSADAVAQ